MRTPDSPAEGIVYSNALSVPFPFVVERKAAVGWIEESELVHSPGSPLEVSCGVGGAAAPFGQLLWGNNWVTLELGLEPGLGMFWSGNSEWV